MLKACAKSERFKECQILTNFGALSLVPRITRTLVLKLLIYAVRTG